MPVLEKAYKKWGVVWGRHIRWCVPKPLALPTLKCEKNRHVQWVGPVYPPLPREENVRVNLLSKLVNTKKHDHNKTMIQETLTAPNTEKEEFNTINVTHA